jgi:hypothetical protein
MKRGGRGSRSALRGKEDVVKLSEVVKKVIKLARARNEYWDTELPKRHPDYPLVNPGEDSGPPPPEQVQLGEFLGDLPEDTIYKLMLIVELGRSYLDMKDLAHQFEEIKEDWADPEEAVSYLTEYGPLDDVMADGWDKLKENKIDLDKLLPRPVKARK